MSEKSKRIPIVINPLDLNWKYIKGGGPGGQAINKTSNCVQLTHIPTGIMVKCQQSRVLETNKNYAIKYLKEKLDLQVNGELSKISQEQQKARNQKKRRERRSALKYQNNLDQITQDKSDKLIQQ